MAPSRAPSISVKYIILAAAILGTLQAAAWFSLSLVSILFYESVIEIDSSLTNGYEKYIYDYYLNRNNPNVENFIIYPTTFNFFMFIYLVLSFIWLVSSCCIIWAVFRGKWKNMSKLLIFWSTVTIAIAVTDIILMGLIAADLQAAPNKSSISTVPTTVATTTPGTTSSPNFPTSVSTSASSLSTTPSTEPSSETTTTSSTPLGPIISKLFQKKQLSEDLPSQIFPQRTSMGVVMTIAARGYVLWCINVILAISLIILVSRMKKLDRPTLLPPIDGYATGPRPFSLYDQTDIGTGHTNNGFSLDDSIIFSPRQTADSKTENTSKNPLSHSNRSSINNSNSHFFSLPKTIEIARPSKVEPAPSPKLAKIGKNGKGRRTPPQKFSSPLIPSYSPYIPDPDYTPPSSPHHQPKSVLKPRSKYIF